MSHDSSADDTLNNSLVVSPTQLDHRQGSLTASLVLVEYGDFQSPQTAILNTLIKTIQHQEHDLCFVFRHFPQRHLHPQSLKAAAAAEAASAQGLFWQMFDRLFAHQQALGNGYLVEYAAEIGLDIPQFLREIARDVHLDRIHQDIASATQSGVRHAPALFINQERYRDVLALEPLTTALLNARNFS
ncbi:MAG TPA: thioredoxin domain-containing protein [Leptolyngbya sp.]|jgi:protein-disulfide isomerase|nr:thioredoxin domain-containing protein [Leptolyngbya sp.]